MVTSRSDSEKEVVLFFRINFSLLILLISNFLLILNTALASSSDDFNDLIKKVQINSQRSYDEINRVIFRGRSKTYVYFGYSPFDVNLIP
jgi:hypothetical protein